MSDIHGSPNNARPSGTPNGSGPSTERNEPVGATAAKQQQAERAAREADKVIEKAADASRDATQANREILQRNVQTAHAAVSSGLEAGAQGLEALTQSMARSFGMTNPNPELAEQSARNIRAVSEASTALVRGTQEASRAWFELVQGGVRANLEAFGELTRCRTLQDFTALQSRVALDNLQRMLQSGELITQASTRAIGDANRAIAAAPGQAAA